MKRLLNFKRLLSKKNKSGFTLVEVVISCALLGILIAGVVAFMTPVLSMIRSEHKSARATMLAESLDTYIAGCLKNAAKVEVFANANFDEAKSSGIYGTTPQVTGGVLNLTIFMEAGTNAQDYELRCLAFAWDKDEASVYSDHKKLMLFNCTVDNNFSGGYSNKLRITNAYKVFDDSLYDGLYPKLSLETFLQQDASGAEIPNSNADGYRIVSRIYQDANCYNVISDAARERCTMLFEGATYVQCSRMGKYGGHASFVANVKSTQAAIDSQRTGRSYTENNNTYYYPDTLIYYAVPK